MDDPLDQYEMIYSVVASIPRGRVATYGQVAEMAGLPGHARQVGYALKVMPDDGLVPWHRVVNAKGETSPRAIRGADKDQRRLLEAEGVEFNARGRLELSHYRWETEDWS